MLLYGCCYLPILIVIILFCSFFNSRFEIRFLFSLLYYPLDDDCWFKTFYLVNKKKDEMVKGKFGKKMTQKVCTAKWQEKIEKERVSIATLDNKQMFLGSQIDSCYFLLYISIHAKKKNSPSLGFQEVI